MRAPLAPRWRHDRVAEAIRQPTDTTRTAPLVKSFPNLFML